MTRPSIELYCGRWQSALDQVPAITCQAVITDIPYGQRTRDGFKSGKAGSEIGYEAWSPSDVQEYAEWAVGAAEWWVLTFCSHDQAHLLEAFLSTRGMYVFAPIPWVRTDGPPRQLGDGPASAAEWLVVARHRKRLPRERTGSRPGYYYGPGAPHGERAGLIGQKPLWLMQAVIRDYTLPGDTIVDCCAGSGTTLIAAVTEGRSAIGCEKDPATYGRAMARLGAGYTPALPLAGPAARAEQLTL